MTAGLAAVLAVGQVTLAVDGGDTNGFDGNNYCNYCDDNPDGVKGSYSYDNGQHDFLLQEWVEPHYDRLREQDMEWGPNAENKLDNECSNRFLSFEQRIHDQYYYDLLTPVSYSTNLPVDGGPSSENAVEELIQGYSEFDTEMHECQQINQITLYYLQFRVDSEKPPTSSHPTFHSEIEWCDDVNPLACNYDETGRYKKKVLQQ